MRRQDMVVQALSQTPYLIWHSAVVTADASQINAAEVKSAVASTSSNFVMISSTTPGSAKFICQ
jgi:hypothetical protein